VTTQEWDSKPWRELRDAKLGTWMLGNADAAQTIVMLSTISETWDDLVDGDEVTAGEIHGAFISATVGLQCNPFYKKWEPMITGVVLAGINAWLDSLELERSDNEAGRMQAFYIRNYAYELVNVCAFAVGGFAHMRAVSQEMRAFVTHETYQQWEHRHAA
jgi:hypothetical protein